jgi:hypothetical protein
MCEVKKAFRAKAQRVERKAQRKTKSVEAGATLNFLLTFSFLSFPLRLSLRAFAPLRETFFIGYC